MEEFQSSRSALQSQLNQKVSCQRDGMFDSGAAPHFIRKSSDQKRAQRKAKACHRVPRVSLVGKFSETDKKEHSIEEESHENKQVSLKIHRSRLEKDVLRLQRQLQQELDLHYALESAIVHAAGSFPKFPRHLPVHAQELLADIATLEVAVSKLEQQMVALNLQLEYERKERQKAESKLNESPRQSREELNLPSMPPSSSIESTEATPNPSPNSVEKSFNWSPSDFSRQHPCLTCSVIPTPVQPPSPWTLNCLTSSSPATSEKSFRGTSSEIAPIPKQSLSWSFSSDGSDMQMISPPRVCRVGDERIWLQPTNGFHKKEGKDELEPCEIKENQIHNGMDIVDAKPLKTSKGELSTFSVKSGKHSARSSFSSSKNAADELNVMDVKHLWRQPNWLSQEMVFCMINIYSHLTDPAVAASKASLSGNILSPTSPFGHITSSSISSFSESSLLSFTRSPPVELPNKEEIGTENTFDPYRTREKLPWADIGRYKTTINVSWMCVGKEQLEYAAEALRKFRSLVEQLSKVDPSSMRHEEKLAFWINIYNALMMHAYLAYGVPRSDLKFFSMMQKAAYTVGGHSFNALTIEHVLLKGKAPGYRPQYALMLALCKLKVPEIMSKFSIDRVEPLTVFALSCGTSSSPAVRVYTAKNIQAELQAALHDYVRASVGISAKGKLLVPKLLYTFARELVEESALLDWVCQFLPWAQACIVQDCMQQRRHRFLSSRNFAVVPFDFRFRYLFLLEDSRAAAQ